MVEVLQHGNKTLVCPECDSKNIIEQKHYDHPVCVLEEIFTLGKGNMVKRCMDCNCVFKE